MLTLSVIAMTVSLNRPGTSVGNGKARAANNPPTYTCKSFKIVTSNNGAGESNASIGADYANGKLIYYVDIESTTQTWGTLLNIQSLLVPLRFVSKSGDSTRATFSLDFPSYTPPENIKGTTLQFSSENMTLDGIAVGGTCTASLTIGAGPTPTPPPVTNTPTPTPTPDGGYSAKYENGAVEYRFPGTNDAGAQVILKSGEMRIGDIKSGLLRLNVQNSNKDAICGQYIWYVQTTNTRSPDISANVTCPPSGTTTTTPTLVSYSVSSDGGTVSPDGHTLTIPKSHTKNIIVKATTSNPGKKDNVLEKGKLNIYKKVDPAQADVLTKQDEHIVAPTAEGNNATFTWTFPKPAGQETDFQANFYPGSTEIQERVIIKVVDDPKTCVKVTCANNSSKSYYVSSKDSFIYTENTCATKLVPTLLAYCNDGAVFNPGVDGDPNRGAGTGAITIPKKLIIRSHFTVPGSSYSPDKPYAFGVTDPDSAVSHYCLKTRAGTFTSNEPNNSDLICSFNRTNDGGADFIVAYALNGETTVRKWLTGYGYLWGTSISDTTLGVAYVAGRGGQRNVPLGGINYNVYHNGQAYEDINVNVITLP